METATWGSVLQNVTPNQGPSPLPLGDYNFKILMGRGQTASTGKEMISVQFEVIDGPAAGRKTWHNWVMPDVSGDPEKAATSFGYFLGDMEVLGLTKDWFVQALGGQPVNKQTCDFIAQQLIGRAACATVTEQKNDKSRRNIGGFRAIDPTLASMQAPGSQPVAFIAPQVGSPFGAPQVMQQFGAPPQAPMQAPQVPQQVPMQAPQQAPQQFQPGAMPVAPPQQQQFASPPPSAQPAQGYAPQAPAGQFQAPSMQAPDAPQQPAAAMPQGFPGAPVQPPAVTF